MRHCTDMDINELGDRSRQVLHGYDFAVEDMENAFANILFDCGDSMLEKIKKEIIQEVQESVKEYMDSFKTEMVVALAEREYMERENPEHEKY